MFAILLQPRRKKRAAPDLLIIAPLAACRGGLLGGWLLEGYVSISPRLAYQIVDEEAMKFR
jgi:hypothetical protein